MRLLKLNYDQNFYVNSYGDLQFISINNADTCNQYYVGIRFAVK